MVLVSTECSLIWQDWNDIHIVYQPSSAETHVFNQTTALILKSLENGPLSLRAVIEQITVALGGVPGELFEDDFKFATMRLEELGLLECLDDASVVQ